MRRSIIGIAIILAAVAATPVRANVTSVAGVDQQFWIYGFDMMSGDSFNLQVRSSVIERSTDASVTPAATYEASMYRRDCENYVCTTVNAPTQPVQPTALSVDPLGNSGTFRATLQSDVGPVAVDVTFTRPEMIGYCGACFTPNAWFDPTTNTVGASVQSYAAVYRTRYAVSARLNNAPVVLSGPFWYVDDVYATSVPVGVSAILP